jgi:hypothetical protein
LGWSSLQSLPVTSKETPTCLMHLTQASGFCFPAAPADPRGGIDDITMSPITKLMVPGPNCMMLPASGHAGPTPQGYFIHPDTGCILPEAGHLGYDLLSGTLVPTSDSNSGATLAH